MLLRPPGIGVSARAEPHGDLPSVGQRGLHVRRRFLFALLIIGSVTLVLFQWTDPITTPVQTPHHTVVPPAQTVKPTPAPPRFNSYEFVVVPKEPLPPGSQVFPVLKSPKAYEIQIGDYGAVRD